MVLTPVGISTVSRLLQSENALYPIVNTESGMVMAVRLLQPENRLFGIFVIP